MIGVFDSGFGGLTVHRALIEALPDRDFVYLGDNRNAPYGTRPPIEVLNLTCAGMERLFAEGCTLAIIACNTASVVALRWIQQQWLPARRREDGVARNVIGIVVPTIEAATGIAWDGVLRCRGSIRAVRHHRRFCHRRTVETDCYPVEIRKRRPDITVVQQACPELAGAIEQGSLAAGIRALVEQYVGELRQTAGADARLRDSRLHALPASRRLLRRRPARAAYRSSTSPRPPPARSSSTWTAIRNTIPETEAGASSSRPGFPAGTAADREILGK